MSDMRPGQPGGPFPGHLVERAVERMAELGGAAPPSSQSSLPLPNPPVPAPSSSSSSSLAAESSPRTPAPQQRLPEPIGMAALEAAGMAVAGARRSRIAEEWRVTAGQLLRTLRAIRPGEAGIPQQVFAEPAPLGPGQVDRRINPGLGRQAGQMSANLIMVTSSKPNEGKSFSAINLAGSFSLGGLAEVLLLDIDSKPGALSQLLGLAERPGLFDLVADPALRAEDLVLPTVIPGLSILPIGRAATGGAGSVERTVTRPVVAMIEKLSRRYAQRVIILDSPPCLATSDAAALAPAVGQIAMIVEAERTQRGDLEAALDLLRPCPHITLVLNKVRQVTTHSFGDYHYYDG